MKHRDLMAFGVLVILYALFESRAQFIAWRDKFRESPQAQFLRSKRDDLIAQELTDGRA